MRQLASVKMLSAEVRSYMLRRGITRHDLARRMGMAPQTVTDVIAGTNKSQRARRLIEEILNRPIWTDPAEFSSTAPATDNAEHLANLSI